MFDGDINCVPFEKRTATDPDFDACAAPDGAEFASLDSRRVSLRPCGHSGICCQAVIYKGQRCSKSSLSITNVYGSSLSAWGLFRELMVHEKRRYLGGPSAAPTDFSPGFTCSDQ